VFQHACYRRCCGGHGRRPMTASINTSLFATSKKITPRTPPSPRLRSASFTTNVLGEPCVSAHSRQRQAARALRGSVCREALASDALRFTRASYQAAFDASNTTFWSLADALEAARHNLLAFLHLANPRTLCLVLQCHGPFGQLAQLGAIVHEGMRDVAALLDARQLAGNATDAVAVERHADELLVRVETLPLPPHVARAMEHLLERALPPSTSSAQMKVSNF
jgi:hypothetical protein